MRRFLKIVLGLCLVLVLAAIALPHLVPTDALKDKALAQIEAMTGRKISMNDVSFSAFPTIALKASDVKVSNPAWAGTGDMVSIRSLRIGVELLPLLHGAVHLKELTLDTPTVTLIKRGDTANWQLGNAPAPVKPSVQSPQGSTSTAGKNTAPLAIYPGVITLKNGTIIYKDLTTGKTDTFSDANLSLKASDLSQRASLNGDVDYNGKKASLTLTLGKPLEMAAGKPSDVDLSLSLDALQLSWKGTVALGPIPNLTGKVILPEIDVAALQKQGATEAKSAGGTSAAPAGPHPAERWSNDPIALDGLTHVAANLNITINKLKLKKSTLTDIQANVLLAGGALSITTNDIAAYGGTLKAGLNTTSANVINASVKVTKVQAEPLLKDFTDMNNLSGEMNAEMVISTSGASEHAMVNALSGNGNFQMKDGVWKGRNILSMARNIGAAFGEQQSEETKFSELSGTFTIKNGIISNNDLKMGTPLLRVGGAGTADLPGWQVQYLLNPKLVATTSGQGEASGIIVPIRIEGSLDDPRYHPDLSAALKENIGDPGKLKDDAKQVKKNLGNKLDNLLGR